jgi:GT2 family glycosyltransferase
MMPNEQFLKPANSQAIDIIIPAYNSRYTIQKTVISSLFQVLPTGWRKNIIIVNDGSSDGTADYCQILFKGQVQVISHDRNRGRSASRNTGWKSASGQYVVFLDSDCEWLSKDSLRAHLESLGGNADVSTGPIIARNQTFWAEYFKTLQSSREEDFASGNYAAFTSANCAIKRSVLESVGGFDERYRHYGFEDRDFFLRLLALGTKIRFCSEAVIIHTPDSSLKDICRKMKEAGQYSSSLFYAAHREYYVRSSYGRIDCRLHGSLLAALALISDPFVLKLAGLGDKIINFSFVPFKIKSTWVKIISGLAYMVGTYLDTKGQ